MMIVQQSRIWFGIMAIGLTGCGQHSAGDSPHADSRDPSRESATDCATGTPGKTISWRGYTWEVTKGGMAGVAPGNPDNVTVEADGFLHLRLRKESDDTWTASELFTKERLGFGTYQWQIEGPLDVLDKNVVLGLFTYGPRACIGLDGKNEIDFEYGRWGVETYDNVSWTNYPVVGERSKDATQATTFTLNGGTQTTSRFIWTPTSISDFLISGYTAVGSEQGLLFKTRPYTPELPEQTITQEPVPLAINLWAFKNPPSDGKDVEIIIRDFQFVPLADIQDPGVAPVTSEPNSDIASSAAAYAWSANNTATSNDNRVENAGLNDQDTSQSIPLNEGVSGTPVWDAAGLLWSEGKTISRVSFTNGAIDGDGNGYIQNGCSLQITTDGTTWRESGWNISPDYPYSASAGGQSYTFSGPEIEGLRGVRVSGQTGEESWTFNVAELRAEGR